MKSLTAKYNLNCFENADKPTNQHDVKRVFIVLC